MASAAFQKMLGNLSNNKNVQSLLESFQRLSDEIKKRESDLKGKFDAQKEEKLELAWQKYQEIVKVLSASEEKLEKEVNLTLNKIKKSADDLEKNIVVAKKKAIAKKAQLEKSLFKKQATRKTTKKATAKTAGAKTTKKVAKKTVRKTTKKAARKA
ncbi:MAG TPA: actin-binding protein [Bdellovibrio sp.]|uniref:actin-binding protein n=1 Tax=Bdellovibrio sp. TaxID=28201 RepID=UPI002F16FFD1